MIDFEERIIIKYKDNTIKEFKDLILSNKELFNNRENIEKIEYNLDLYNILIQIKFIDEKGMKGISILGVNDEENISTFCYKINYETLRMISFRRRCQERDMLKGEIREMVPEYGFGFQFNKNDDNKTNIKRVLFVSKNGDIDLQK